MRQALLSFFLCTVCLGGCAASTQNNREITALREEIKSDRELLIQTRAELNEIIEVLRPIADLAKFLESSGLLANMDNPYTVSSDEDPVDSTSDQNETANIDALIKTGIKSTKPNEYTIKRSLVDEVLENPMVFARGARIVPSLKNGKANGFKIYAIRPSSVYAKIGLMNGDTIHSINGFELTSPDKVLEVFAKVRTATSFSVHATRRGKPITLNYSIK